MSKLARDLSIPVGDVLKLAPGRPAWLRLSGALRAGAQAIVAVRVERVTRPKLDAMSDHLLRDMGMLRDEVAHISKAVGDRLAPEIKLRTTLFL